jgi:hypothetical protein
MRTYTLLETTRRVNCGEDFSFALKEFMDGISLTRDKQHLISEQPAFLVCESPYLDDNVHNVLLAGIADEMTFRFNLDRPSWLAESHYSYKEPVFTSSDNPEKRALLLIETPSFYRARNLFCGKIFNDAFQSGL